MNQSMSSSTKQSPFEQCKISTSFGSRAPERTTEQVKIDPFGASLSNTINSANTSHATNKFKSTFSAVLDPFGSDEIDGTLHRTDKWKKVPEVGSIVNGSLKMTSKQTEAEFGMIKIYNCSSDQLNPNVYSHSICRSTIEAITNKTFKILLFALYKL